MKKIIQTHDFNPESRFLLLLKAIDKIEYVYMMTSVQAFQIKE